MFCCDDKMTRLPAVGTDVDIFAFDNAAPAVVVEETARVGVTTTSLLDDPQPIVNFFSIQMKAP